MIRVQIFDDNENRRDSLELLINTSDGFELAGSAADCLHAAEDVKRNDPDVILMDIEMPGVNGIQATRLLKQEFPLKHILIQTVFDDTKRVFDAIKAGASGYILKSTPADKILMAIADINEGGAPMTPSIAVIVLEYFRESANAGDGNAKETYNLSERELEVLRLLVDGKSYKMVAEALSIAYNTVNSHVKKIYEKLHVHSVAEAVNKALKNNIVN